MVLEDNNWRNFCGRLKLTYEIQKMILTKHNAKRNSSNRGD